MEHNSALKGGETEAQNDESVVRGHMTSKDPDKDLDPANPLLFFPADSSIALAIRLPALTYTVLYPEPNAGGGWW